MSTVVRTITKGILAAIVALALPMGSWAAGLGRLTVHSPLGQPLNAEIEIVSVQPGEEEGLTARLPTNEAFRQAGIELNPALLSLRFAIEQRDGRPVVRLTTSQAVNEPFLDLLVELQWNTGRLVREYTFLLDPPDYRGGTAIAGSPAPAQKPAAAAPRAEAPAKAEEKPKVGAAAPAAAPDAQTYEVKQGDTLGGIARQHLAAGVSLEQMLAAIYNANRQAFISDNINLVRSGQVLNIPGGEAASGLDNEEARRLVQSHAANFSDYRKRLASAPTPAEAAPGQRESSGRIEPKPQATPPAAAQDQLRLSKAEPGKPAAGARAAREDDLVARERALKEAQSRVTELEKNVADLQKLLELRNQQLAELEKRAKGATAGVPPVAVAPAPAKPEAPKPVAEAPKAAPEAPKPAAEAAKPAAEAPKPAAEAPKAAVEAPRPAPKPSTEFKSTKPRAKPAAQEASLLDELLDNPLTLGGLLLVLLLLIGYGVWAWRRKKAGQARFQDSVLGAASAPASAAAATAAAAAPASSQISSQPPVAGMEPEEVDPIAEADVYMAYGRDSQAEEILKEALQKDPNRAAIHAKLLEIYANRRDKAAFEQAALKLKGLTNATGPEWEKAAALGRSVDPQSGLYGAGAPAGPSPAAAAAAAAAAAVPAAAPSLDFDLGAGTTQEATLPDIPLDEAKERTGPALDFDLGSSTAETPQQKTDFTPEGTLIMGGEKPPESPLAGLDFDLDLSTPDEKRAQASSSPASAPSEASSSIDFDLNLDLGGTDDKAAGAVTPAQQAAPLDLSSIDLDLSEPASPSGAGGADPKWQEVATKLDLAKAYEEMGDRDGARELLAEVVREGDASQKGEAEQMLAKLG